MYFPNIISVAPTIENCANMIVRDVRLRLVESKGSFDLIICNLPGDLGYISIESSSHVLIITENECSFQIEATGDDITSVLPREFHCLFWLQFVFEKEFFVI